MKISVLGAGGWGMALSMVLESNGHEISLWAHEESHARTLANERRNDVYLPGVALPPSIHVSSNMGEVLTDAEAVIVVVPSHAFKAVLAEMVPYRHQIKKARFITATKGIDRDSGRTMSLLISEFFPGMPVAAFSGPNLAPEVARGMPAAAVVASQDGDWAREAQVLFARERFRIYSSTDIVGVELGGALKNIIAIAAGTSDGLGFGDNTKAALVTRGLAEMTRLACACGAQRETLSGLSGMGDLMVTCFSPKSRNHGLGERLGKGESLQSILGSMKMVVEGVKTTESAWHLARMKEVDVPIISAAYAVLYQGRGVAEVMSALLNRDLKCE